MDLKYIETPDRVIKEFCQRWKIVELSLFGSVLGDEFRADSDIDVMVTFAPGSQISLLELGQIRAELTELFGRPVDLVEKAGLRNPYRRKSILESAQVIYAS